jgi:hypothetical protein
MPEEDRRKIRTALLDPLLEIITHGKACIEWADKTIISISEIDTKESEIKKTD